MLIDGGGDVTVATSLLEASNLVVLRVLILPTMSWWFLKYVVEDEFMYCFHVSGIICDTL